LLVGEVTGMRGGRKGHSSRIALSLIRLLPTRKIGRARTALHVTDPY
jgi:hypothetical protein